MRQVIEPRRPDATLNFKVVVSKLPKSGLHLTFEASESERAALARFLQIVSIEALDADLTVLPWRRDGVSVKGRLRARVQQQSVVTLDPLPQEIDEPVNLVFLPENSGLARVNPRDDGELHLDPEGDDIPETFSGDRIDLGAALEELLALALEPYPREEGASFGSYDTDPAPETEAPSPFAQLRALRDAGGKS